MTIRNLLSLFVVAVSTLTMFHGVAALSRPPNRPHGPRMVTLRSTAVDASEPPATPAAPPPPLEAHAIVGCFGRLADKEFVPATVEGTAASGYEFGVLQSGRPKWLCTYTERTGQTQGGGAAMTHVPSWCRTLFPERDNDENGVPETTRDEVLRVLRDESTKFEMPLGAPPGAKQKASDPELFEENTAVVEALWRLLGGKEANSVAMDGAAASLRTAAEEFGNLQGDSMTYAAFEKAIRKAHADRS